MDLNKDKVHKPQTLKGQKPKNLDLAVMTCTYPEGYTYQRNYLTK